jgi:hypothetical protein
MSIGLLSVFSILFPIFWPEEHTPEKEGAGRDPKEGGGQNKNAQPPKRSKMDKLRTVALTLYFCGGFVPLSHWVYLYGYYSTGKRREGRREGEGREKGGEGEGRKKGGRREGGRREEEGREKGGRREGREKGGRREGRGRREGANLWQKSRRSSSRCSTCMS